LPALPSSIGQHVQVAGSGSGFSATLNFARNGLLGSFVPEVHAQIF
jgi:hypothetical protein